MCNNTSTRARADGNKEGSGMFKWAIIFLLVALVAGLFGFTGLAGTAAYFAKIVFGVALVLLVVSLIFGRRVAP